MRAPAVAVGDAAEVLDVDVHLRARIRVLVTAGRVPPGADHLSGGRVALGQERGVVAGPDPAHGRSRHCDAAGKVRGASVGQVSLDPVPGLNTCAGAVRAGGRVDQTGPADLPVAASPPPRRGVRDTDRRGDVRDRAACRDALDHGQPPGRSQLGASVRHERPPLVRAGS